MEQERGYYFQLQWERVGLSLQGRLQIQEASRKGTDACPQTEAEHVGRTAVVIHIDNWDRKEVWEGQVEKTIWKSRREADPGKKQELVAVEVQSGM